MGGEIEKIAEPNNEKVLMMSDAQYLKNHHVHVRGKTISRFDGPSPLP